MKSWTALNINEFILFDMFGSPCRRVVTFSKFAGSLNMVFWSPWLFLFVCLFVYFYFELSEVRKEVRLQSVLGLFVFTLHSVS